MPKYMIIADGLSDSPKNNQEIYNLKENFSLLNGMGSKATYGYFDNFYPNHPTDSLNCIMKLFGAKSEVIPKGRSYLEAMACGINFSDDDIIFRCNLAYFKDNKLSSPNCQDIDKQEKSKLFKSFIDKIDIDGVDIHHIGDYKGIIVLKDMANLFTKVKTLAPHENIGKDLECFTKENNTVNLILNKIILDSISFLNKKDSKDFYAILPWGESLNTPIPTFKAINGKTAALICGTEIVKGIGKAMGIDVFTHQSFTGDTDTNLTEKAKIALAIKDKYDIVIIHINGGDEAAHRKAFKEKLNFLQRAERELLKPIVTQMVNLDKLLICADHGTNSDTAGHIRENQPFVLFSPSYNQTYNLGILNGDRAVSILTD